LRRLGQRADHRGLLESPAGYDLIVGVQSFWYTPSNGAIARIGDHMVVMPAGSVCDPATSGYGADLWDTPCNTVNHSVLITATTYNDIDGHPYLLFAPDLRFLPSKEVDLYLKDGRRTAARELAVAWCPTGGITCVDESINDPSLATQRVGRSAILFRRLKHMSGYYIVNRGECPGSIDMLDDGSLFCNDGSALFRSGYMVASGLGGAGNSGGSISRRKRIAEK
jgi:hypothetical protein